MLWEAHKPVICGMLIRQAAFLQGERKNLHQKLETNFNACHAAFQSSPNPTGKAHLDKALLEFDLFLTDMLLRNRTTYILS